MFVIPTGIKSIRCLPEVKQKVMPSGSTQLMRAGISPKSKSTYHFTVIQGNLGPKYILQRAYTIGLLLQSWGSGLLIPTISNIFRSSLMSYCGILHSILARAFMYMVKCTPRSPFYEHTCNFSSQSENPDANSHELYVLSCCGLMKPTLHRLALLSCGLFMHSLEMNPNIAVENQAATLAIMLLTLRRWGLWDGVIAADLLYAEQYLAASWIYRFRISLDRGKGTS